MATETAASSVTESTSLVPTQLASLVPSFDPAKDDLEQYTNKVELLVEVWPPGKIQELITRLILATTRTAFQKLSLHKAELLGSDDKSQVKKLIALLGGHWGKVTLEQKYESAERALFRCVQRGDESNDSYLARADVFWSELLSKRMDLSQLQAYIVLRGSSLSSEDKKRALVEADVHDGGTLTMSRVSQAIRMLGAGFFHDLLGQKRAKGKTYDATALNVQEDVPQAAADDSAYTMEDFTEEDFVEQMFQDGDEDAALVAEYESSAVEALQEDPDLALAHSTYLEARHRLSERFKNRVFWPNSSRPKEKSKGWEKGKSKSYGGGYKGAGNRKSLQQRIMESSCRLCGKKGHWKAECPERARSTNSAVPTSAAAPTLVIADEQVDAPPLEFLNLPEAPMGALDAPSSQESVFCEFQEFFGVQSKRGEANIGEAIGLDHPKTLENGAEVRTSLHFEHWVAFASTSEHEATACASTFSTYEAKGILDTGATKTVIGSHFVKELLSSLKPAVRQQVQRCPRKVAFRFGNHGTLES